MLIVALAHAEETLDWHVAQAGQFAKKGWYKDAAAEIEKASLLMGANRSFALHDLGARVWYELGDVPRAIQWSATATSLAPDDPARERTLAFSAWLGASFGHVEVRPPYPDASLPVGVVRAEPQLDPELDRYTRAAVLRLKGPQPLPLTLSLPVGAWTIAGQAVRVDAGQTATVTVPGRAAVAADRVEVGLGVGAELTLSSQVVAAPGARVGLGAWIPLGPIGVQAEVVWAPATWAAPAGDTGFSAVGAGVALGVGRTFPLAGPLGLRPAVGARWRQVPAVGLACSADGACATPSGDEPYAWVYAVGQAVGPWLAADLRWSGTGRLCAGFGVTVEQDFGWLDASGTAHWRDAEGETPWSVDDPAFGQTVLGARLQAALAF